MPLAILSSMGTRRQRCRRLALGLGLALTCAALGCAVVSPPGDTLPEAGPPPPGVGHSSGDRSSPANDAGTPPPRLMCPPDPLPYEAGVSAVTVGHQGLCSTGDIDAFIAACIGTVMVTQPGCPPWLASNTKADGGVGTPCGNCLIAPNGRGNGGVWVDPLGYYLPNFGACIEVIDPVHGRACAEALMDTLGCQALACEYCANDDAYMACITAVNTTACASYVDATNSSCAVDIDEYSTCTALGTASTNFAYIASLVCGHSDAPDAGLDASAD
jgi:hypothetical protein